MCINIEVMHVIICEQLILIKQVPREGGGGGVYCITSKYT